MGGEVQHGARPRRGGAAAVGDVLAGYLRERGLAERMRDVHVLQAWRDSSAATYGARARALRFRDGELVIEVASAAHLQELQSFTGEELRRAANRRLGTERIRRVSFKLAR